MKITLILALFAFSTFQIKESKPIITKIEVDNSKTIELIKLFKAFAKHESNFNASDTTGDGGEAHGILQIHKVMIDDVNRIIGEKKYHYADRLCPIKSFEIFEIIMNFYNPTLDIRKACLIWNGKNMPESYFESVKCVFKNY